MLSSYIQNQGFTKTIFQGDRDILQNEIKWQGDYNGKIANINVDINDNGNKEFVSMQLDNNTLRQLFGIQPVEIPLEKRLLNDYLSRDKYNPIALEGALIKRKKYSHKKRRKTKHKKNEKRRKKTQRIH